LGLPGSAVGYLRMLELIERHIGGRPDHGAIAPTANDAWDFF
jgi:hypothetical protein